MNTKTKLLISGFIALSLVLSIVALEKKGGSDVIEVERPIQVGSLTGPNVGTDYLCVNGSCTYYYNVAMNNSSTTMCQIVTPDFPTVLVPFSLMAQLTNSSSTASYLTIATSTANSEATTTLIAATKIGASQFRGHVIATTSSSSLIDGVFASSTTINFGRTGGSGPWTNTGNCQGAFRKL